MWDMINLNFRVMRLGLDIMQLQQHALNTIILRQPLIFGDDKRGRQESLTMVSEKMQAAVESSFGLFGAYAALWRHPWGSVRAGQALVRFTETGVKPYRLKVAANSRRLSRAKRQAAR